MRATLAGYVRAQAGDAGEGIRRHQFWGGDRVYSCRQFMAINPLWPDSEVVKHSEAPPNDSCRLSDVIGPAYGR